MNAPLLQSQTPVSHLLAQHAIRLGDAHGKHMVNAAIDTGQYTEKLIVKLQELFGLSIDQYRGPAAAAPNPDQEVANIENIIHQAKERAVKAWTGPAPHQPMYDEIIRIYDLAEGVLKAASHENLVNRKFQMAIARSFIMKTIKSVDTISSMYSKAIEQNLAVAPTEQAATEAAFRAFFGGLNDIVNSMEEHTPESLDTTGKRSKINPQSPLAKQFLERPKRGTEGSRIDRMHPFYNDTNGVLLLNAVDETACHFAQLLLDTKNKGLVTSYEMGNPARGIASNIARKAATANEQGVGRGKSWELE